MVFPTHGYRGANARAAGEEMTLQRLLEMVQGLQGDMADSRLEQDRMQVDLDASEARNAELHRVNEELRRNLRKNRGRQEPDEMEPLTSP